MSEHLQTVVAALRNAPGLENTEVGACTLTRLGGLTNLVHLVEVGGHKVIVRIPGEGTEEYIDRAVEITNANAAHKAGVSAEVIDLRTIYPWDREAVLTSVEKTGRLVVAHETHLTGGFGAEIVSTVTEQGAYFLETPPVRVGHMDVFWGPTRLEQQSVISSERIAAGARRAMRG